MGGWLLIVAAVWLTLLIPATPAFAHDISDADLGGNCELINPPVETAKNLHALWDGGIIAAMDVDAKTLAASLEKEIAAMPDSDRQGIANGNQDDWVWEGHQIAMEDIYRKLHVPTEPVVFPRVKDDISFC